MRTGVAAPPVRPAHRAMAGTLLDLAAAADHRGRRGTDEDTGCEGRADGGGDVVEDAGQGAGHEEDRDVGCGSEHVEDRADDLADRLGRGRVLRQRGGEGHGIRRRAGAG